METLLGVNIQSSISVFPSKFIETYSEQLKHTAVTVQTRQETYLVPRKSLAHKKPFRQFCLQMTNNFMSIIILH